MLFNPSGQAIASLMKSKDSRTKREKTMSVRWSAEERRDIEAAAELLGVLDTTVIRLAVKEFLDKQRRDRTKE